MMKTKFVVATIIFSGELNPDPEAAEKALCKAGYDVTRMPEGLRSLMAVPGDCFLKVTKLIACDPEDMVNEINEIVDRYGAIVHDCEPIVTTMRTGEPTDEDVLQWIDAAPAWERVPRKVMADMRRKGLVTFTWLASGGFFLKLTKLGESAARANENRRLLNVTHEI